MPRLPERPQPASEREIPPQVERGLWRCLMCFAPEQLQIPPKDTDMQKITRVYRGHDLVEKAAHEVEARGVPAADITLLAVEVTGSQGAGGFAGFYKG